MIVEVLELEVLEVEVLEVEVAEVVIVDNTVVVVVSTGPFASVSSSRHEEIERMFRTPIWAPSAPPPEASYEAKMKNK